MVTGVAQWQGTFLRICEALDLTTSMKQTNKPQRKRETQITTILENKQQNKPPPHLPPTAAQQAGVEAN